MKTIGQNIAEKRRMKGLTQDQVAEKVGISPQAVSKWECDQSSPDAETLVKLSRLFGTTVDDLLTGSGVKLIAADMDTIDRRVLRISIKDEGGSFITSFPASLILHVADDNFMEKLFSNNPKARETLVPLLDFIKNMIKNGVIGEIYSSIEDEVNSKDQIRVFIEESTI